MVERAKIDIPSYTLGYIKGVNSMAETAGETLVEVFGVDSGLFEKFAEGQLELLRKRTERAETSLPLISESLEKAGELNSEGKLSGVAEDLKKTAEKEQTRGLLVYRVDESFPQVEGNGDYRHLGLFLLEDGELLFLFFQESEGELLKREFKIESPKDSELICLALIRFEEYLREKELEESASQ